MGQPRPLYRLFLVFSKLIWKILQQINVHPVYGVGIRTHNLPKSLDHGSRPTQLLLVIYLPTYLPAYQPTNLPTYLLTYLPTYLPTY